MKTIGLGIIGCGSFIQRRILPALNEVKDFKIICLHNRNIEKAKQMGQSLHVPYYTASREELLKNREVDAVYIASPHHLHEEDAIACALMQKPTLCEKPLAPTVDAVKKIIKAFEENETPLFVGHSLRFKPSVQKAKAIVEEGKIGKLLSFRTYVTIPLSQDNWRHKKECGGGALQDLGVHLVDLIHFITGQKITSIFAYGNIKEVDETVLAICKLENGALAAFHCSFEQPLSSGFEIIGSQGRIISTDSLRQTYDPVETFCHIQENDTKIFPRLLASNIYVDELKHFADCLLNKTPSLIPANIALQNQIVIEAAYLSLLQRKEIAA